MLTRAEQTPIRVRDDAAVDFERLWRFLAVETEPAPSDVIFAFGSANLGVARAAARLHAAGVAPWVLVTGAAPKRGLPTEAHTYAKHVTAAGVARDRIIVEAHATNTGENVAFGMAAAAARGLQIDRAMLVAFPTSLRRCAATFAWHFPQVATRTHPAFASLAHFEATDDQVRRTLLAEIDRLVEYPALGYFAPQVLPRDVAAAAARLRDGLADAPVLQAAARS